jgi:hypothetical protein
MKSDLWASRRNEARGRKNWGKKGVVRRYRKPKKTPRKTRLPRKNSFNHAVNFTVAALN